jgi:hypothetical protein
MFTYEKMSITEFNIGNPPPELDKDWVPYDLVWVFHELLYLIQMHFTNGNQDVKDILNKIVKFFFYFTKPPSRMTLIKPERLATVKAVLLSSDQSRTEISSATGIPRTSVLKSLRYLVGEGEVISFKRKDVEGLGRKKIIYRLLNKGR